MKKTTDFFWAPATLSFTVGQASLMGNGEVGIVTEIKSVHVDAQMAEDMWSEAGAQNVIFLRAATDEEAIRAEVEYADTFKFMRASMQGR